MQRKSSARQKAVSDPQRSAGFAPMGRAARVDIKAALPPPSSSTRGSGETTLGGHVDRGLTLAALYDLGVLERLRLEVRLRLISDLTQSLAWMHANPRLMAAHPHLVVTPSTIVIGLDGVARVDVRAAKKHESGRNPLEADYVAPEVANGDSTADLRADVYSLGVLTWEALAGQRISAPGAWSSAPVRPDLQEDGGSDLPAALGGTRERDPLRRKPQSPARPAAPASQSRLRAPPPLTLPEGGEWAMPLAELALQAMGAEPSTRPSDCRPLIRELDLISSRLATTQEIAEVVQGISAVDTLCVPLPTLPDVDATCQSDGTGLGFMDRQPCAVALMPTCAQRPSPLARKIVEPAPASAPLPASVPIALGAIEPVPEVSKTVRRLREMSSGSSGRAWVVAGGLFWLAVLGLLAGYAASVFAVH
jgi:hypothetical protein